MKHIYYAVAPIKSPDEFKFATAFATINYMTCSLPSGRDGWVDSLHYRLKKLTLEEYETHLEIGSLEYSDSDNFAVFN